MRFLVFILVLTACGSGVRSTRVGLDVHEIECQGPCYEAAQEVCPNGYQQLDSDEGLMRVRCKSY